MITNILVPLDRSETADRVSDWAARFAVRVGATMTLLAVVDPSWLSVLEPIGNGRRFDSDSGSGVVTAVGTTVGAATPRRTVPHTEIEPGFGTHEIDIAVQIAHAYLDAHKSSIESKGVSVETAVRMGDPASQIRIASTEFDAELIVMATHRKSQISRGVLGSVTDRVTRTSGVPVLAIHPATLESIGEAEDVVQSIILPLDGSSESERAVPLAVALAASASADLILLSAIGSRFPGFFGDQTKERLNRVAFTNYLERISRQAVPASVKTSIEVIEGDPDDVIRKSASEHEKSVVVLSSHGASGIKRMVIGSVADKVIRTSERPVVVVTEANSTP